jgi:hypothetical protein
MEDLYIKNYSTLMKEMKGDSNKWIDNSCSWTGKIDIGVHTTQNDLQIPYNHHHHSNVIK